MKKIAFIGRVRDFREYCLDNSLNPDIFVNLNPLDSNQQEKTRGLWLQGLVVSDWAVGQEGTKALVLHCSLRIRY